MLDMQLYKRLPIEMANVRRNLLDVDSVGNIYALDESTGDIFVSDPSAEKHRTIPCPIKEPGTFRFLACDRLNGHLWIGHLRRGSSLVDVITFRGEPKRTIETTIMALIEARFLPNGALAASGIPRDSGPYRSELKIMNRELQEVTTLLSAPNPQRGRKISFFEPGLVWAVGANGMIYFSRPDDYWIQSSDPGGNPVKRFERDFTPVAVTEEERIVVSKSMPSYYEADFREFHGAFQDLSVDGNGRIFVRTWERRGPNRDFVYDVLDPEGNLLARISLPAKLVFWQGLKAIAIVEEPAGEVALAVYEARWKRE